MAEISITQPQSTYLKADEVANILNISRSFAYKLLKSGQIPVIIVGRSIRVRLSDLQQFIAEHSVGIQQDGEMGDGDVFGGDHD